MDSLETAIRERAYLLWEAAGRADGMAETHWLAAEREVLAAAMEQPARRAKTIAPQAAAKPRAKRRAA